jgi:predicted RNA-binding protein YlxR (DUF448 family)
MRERKCIQTGEVLPETKLVRFAIGPDDVVVPDVKARAPGRGLWVKADRTVLEAAMKSRSFARAAKAKVVVPDDLAGRTEEALMQAALDLLGLAKRSGELLCGFDQVRGVLQSRRPACLVEASDGAMDGRRKLQALGQGKWGGVAMISCFTQGQMGGTIGRAESTHMALLPGGLAEQFMFHAERLCAFRLLFSDETGDKRS